MIDDLDVHEADLTAGDLAASAQQRALPNRRRPTIPAYGLMRHREVRRVAAFLVAGGLSALVTITATAFLTDLAQARFLWSAIIGTELGILVNFFVNDRVAFRDLAGHKRALPVRLLRFHLTCALGQSIILLLSLVLHDMAHWSTIFAQALPIGVVTCVNFTMHRFWTYRGGRGLRRP
jgi:putative flippase GtrA